MARILDKRAQTFEAAHLFHPSLPLPAQSLPSKTLPHPPRTPQTVCSLMALSPNLSIGGGGQSLLDNVQDFMQFLQEQRSKGLLCDQLVLSVFEAEDKDKQLLALLQQAVRTMAPACMEDILATTSHYHTKRAWVRSSPSVTTTSSHWEPRLPGAQYVKRRKNIGMRFFIMIAWWWWWWWYPVLQGQQNPAAAWWRLSYNPRAQAVCHKRACPGPRSSHQVSPWNWWLLYRPPSP